MIPVPLHTQQASVPLTTSSSQSSSQDDYRPIDLAWGTYGADPHWRRAPIGTRAESGIDTTESPSVAFVLQSIAALKVN